MFRNLILVILIAIALTYSAGFFASEWFGFRLQLEHHLLEPLTAFAVLALVIVIMVVVGFIIALSVFGALLFVIGAVIFAVVFAGIGAFWPVILFGLVILYLVKDRHKVQGA